MKEFLTFQLYGSLVSWGEIAVGESRHSAAYPSKSALLGLLGAALGIDRDDEQEQSALASSYRFSIKMLSGGSLLKDFHTTQVVTQQKKKNFLTRRDALLSNNKYINTILSMREYRCDALSVVALEAEQSAPYTLLAIKEALLRPKFNLYLGRKSCPLALPLYPQLKYVAGVKVALDQAADNLLGKKSFEPTDISEQKNLNSTHSNLHRAIKHLSCKQDIRYYWEGDRDDLKIDLTTIRHDQPLNRRRWQFAPRYENQQTVRED